MPKRMIFTALGYAIFIVLPFLYMLMTIHHLLTADDMNSVSRIAAAEVQNQSVQGVDKGVAN